MSLLRRFPWASSLLLLVAYTTFGKFVMSSTHPWIAFGISATWGLVLAIMMINPLKGIRQMLLKWFKSDTVAFSSLVAAAAFASILLNWFRLFLPVIMILAAESLVRLDLQTAEFRTMHVFIILVLTAWLGLGLGWLVMQVI
jgi:hypothetical protein